MKTSLLPFLFTGVGIEIYGSKLSETRSWPLLKLMAKSVGETSIMLMEKAVPIGASAIIRRTHIDSSRVKR